jgi:hypothetical protein
MPKYLDRVRVYTATTGTGAVNVVAGSVYPGGYRGFSAAGAVSGDVFRYAISEGNNAEVGLGTFNGTTLTRTPDPGWSLLNLTGGADVMITYSTEDIKAIEIDRWFLGD